MTTQIVYGGKAVKSTMPDSVRYSVLAVFVILMVGMTYLNIMTVEANHLIKTNQGYKFDANDLKFKSVFDVVKLCVFCMIAAGLCGMTGIAGGMVLGPLFLTYNMIPQMMSGTNQYITMIASISVAAQFAGINALNPWYSLLFGVITVICAFIGIQSVNIYIAKTGK